MQAMLVPAGHAIEITVDASQAPLAQRWKIGAWGKRDGTAQPIPTGWTPPNGPASADNQLIFEDEKSFDHPPSHEVITWGPHNHDLMLSFEAFALRGWQYVSQDRISYSDKNEIVIDVDRTQDTRRQPNYSNHYGDMHVVIKFNPPLP